MEVMNTLNGNRIEQLTQRKTNLSIYIYNILVNLYHEDIITEDEFYALCNNPSLIVEIAKSKKSYKLKGIRYRRAYIIKKYDAERKEIINEIQKLRSDAETVIAPDIERENEKIELFKRDLARFQRMKKKPSQKMNQDLLDMLIEKTEIDIRIAEENIKLIRLNASDIISDDIYEIANTPSHRGVEYERKKQDIYDRIAYEAADLRYHQEYIDDIMVLRDTYDTSKYESQEVIEDTKVTEVIPESEVIEETLQPAEVEEEVVETVEETLQPAEETAQIEPETKEKTEELVEIKQEPKVEKLIVQEKKQEKEEKEEKIETKEERKNIGGGNMENKRLESVSKDYNNAKNTIRNILMYKSILGKNTPGLSDDDINRYIASYEETISDLRKNNKLSDSELHRIYTELNNESYIVGNNKNKVDSNEYQYIKGDIIQDMPIYSKEEQTFNTKGMTEEEIIDSQNKINSIPVYNPKTKSDNESSLTQSDEEVQLVRQTSTEDNDDLDEQIEETKRKLEELENKKKAGAKVIPIVTPVNKQSENKSANDNKTTNETVDYTNPLDVIKEIQELNPDAKIMLDPENGTFDRIYSSVSGYELKLPKGFYYNDKNGITNKHNTKNGQYLSIKVDELTKDIEPSLVSINGNEPEIKSYVEYNDIDDSEAEEKKKPKEGWFKRNWKKFTKKVKDNWKAITAWGVSLAFLSLLGYGTYKYIKDNEIEDEKNKVDDTTRIEETVKPDNTDKTEEKSKETTTQSYEQSSNKSTGSESTSNDKTNEIVEVPADPEVEIDPSKVDNRPEGDYEDVFDTSSEKKSVETVSSNNANGHYDYINNVYHYNTNESETYYSAYGAHEDGKVELNPSGDTTYSAYGAHPTNPYNTSDSNYNSGSSSSTEAPQQEESTSNMNSESAEALAYYEEQMEVNENIHNNNGASYQKADSIFADKIEQIRSTNGSDQAYVEQVINEIYDKVKNPGTSNAEDMIKICTDGITATKYSNVDHSNMTSLFDKLTKEYAKDIQNAKVLKK